MLETEEKKKKRGDKYGRRVYKENKREHRMIMIKKTQNTILVNSPPEFY